ncbi:hypothetical protein COO60DRAFT_491147 [Scenedesmus sp. NREL 46B-D3]|nr:hypothetical protein COO60DRAFT_491147 [Scenedesmus sp. NREL 46B-D3]
MQISFQPGFTAVNVGWDEAAGNVGHIVLNRPNKSNAFDSAMWREFPAAVRLLQQRDEIRVVRNPLAGRQSSSRSSSSSSSSSLLQAAKHVGGDAVRCQQCTSAVCRMQSHLVQHRQGYSWHHPPAAALSAQ